MLVGLVSPPICGGDTHAPKKINNYFHKIPSAIRMAKISCVNEDHRCQFEEKNKIMEDVARFLSGKGSVIFKHSKPTFYKN